MRASAEREAALVLSQARKQAAEIAITSERDATANREAAAAEADELHKTSTAKAEEILSAAKPATVRIKVRALKKIKDAAL